MNRTLLHYCRLIHTYLTMMGLAALLLFGVTGFTNSHEEWFGATSPVTTEKEGQAPRELIEKQDHLRLVEHLRLAYSISGAMTAYDINDDSIDVAFKSPKQTCEVRVEKADGKVSVRIDTYNTIALLNNLHRGRYSGAAWRWVIDISAILLVVACVTGFVMWLSMPRRRKWGLAAVFVGTIATLVVYGAMVPGKDEVKPGPRAAATTQGGDASPAER